MANAMAMPMATTGTTVPTTTAFSLEDIPSATLVVSDGVGLAVGPGTGLGVEPGLASAAMSNVIAFSRLNGRKSCMI